MKNFPGAKTLDPCFCSLCSHLVSAPQYEICSNGLGKDFEKTIQRLDAVKSSVDHFYQWCIAALKSKS